MKQIQPSAAQGGLPLAERRNSARRPWLQEIALRPVGLSVEGIRWASVQNISTTGIGLLLSCHYKKGTPLVLELPTVDGPAIQLLGRVVHGKQRSHGNSYMGCVFQTALPADCLPGNDTQAQPMADGKRPAIA